MLGQRRRKFTNVKPTLGQCIIFAGQRVCAILQKKSIANENCKHMSHDPYEI